MSAQTSTTAATMTAPRRYFDTHVRFLGENETAYERPSSISKEPKDWTCKSVPY